MAGSCLPPHAVKIDLLIIDDKTAALFSDQNDWEQWETKENLRAAVLRGAYQTETVIRIGIDEM